MARDKRTRVDGAETEDECNDSQFERRRMKPEKRSWQARVQAALDDQFLERLRPEERARERLRWEDWESVRREAVSFAENEIRRRKWRGEYKGVVPGGVDAEDVANQVIAEVLSSTGRIALGLTRSRLLLELKRLISGRVRVLHGRKETSLVRSEWEVSPVKDGEEPISVFEGVRGTELDACEAVTQRERSMANQHAALAIEMKLGSDDALRRIFQCLRAGILRSEEIAERLGMDKASVARGRRRLAGRLRRFAGRVGR